MRSWLGGTIVLEYNFARIHNYVRQLIEACVGETWEQVALQVGRLGKWEFEDYTAHPASATVTR